jgi:hypothetical protein
MVYPAGMFIGKRGVLGGEEVPGSEMTAWRDSTQCGRISSLVGEERSRVVDMAL